MQSVVQLAEHGHTASNPVFWIHFGLHSHVHHEVSGVASGGENAPSCGCFVEGALIDGIFGLPSFDDDWL